MLVFKQYLKENNKKDELVINKMLKYIKKETGLDLKLDTYFTGIEKFKGMQYFNVDLEEPANAFSEKLLALEELAKKSNTIKKVAKQGISRVAIFF